MIDQAPDPMIPGPFCIQRVRRETEDAFTVELAPVNGAGETSFAPGQFNMLYVFGVGEIPVSISGDPKERTKLVHTTHAGCGAICPAYDRGCYGCFGPMEVPNASSLGDRFEATGSSRDEIVRAFRAFNAHAEAFRRESEAHEK